MFINMPHWPKPMGMRPTNYNLDNIHELLTRLGNPERQMPPIVHVAGTNGKGSTIAFMKAILMKSGYRVHTYTSPHLVYFNERITLANQYISSAYLYATLEECRIAAKEMRITFFEGTTAAAFLAFSKIDADIVIIETGLGGRLDATNVLKQPILSVLTPISYDHQEYLGHTIEAISAEKAGIIKRGSTCIISEQQEQARHILEDQAIKQRATVYRQNFEWSCEQKKNHMIFKSGGEEIVLPIPSLLGKHQITNAGTAVAALTMLAKKHNYNISYEDIVDGLQDTVWPARLEKIKSGQLIDLLPDTFEVFLDGAHNTAGAQALYEWIKPQKIHCILGMTQGRDTKDFLKMLKPILKKVYCVCVQSEIRSQTASSIYSSASALNITAMKCDSLKDAFQYIAHHYYKAQNETVLICGSLFLAGDVLRQNNT